MQNSTLIPACEVMFEFDLSLYKKVLDLSALAKAVYCVSTLGITWHLQTETIYQPLFVPFG